MSFLGKVNINMDELRLDLSYYYGIQRMNSIKVRAEEIVRGKRGCKFFCVYGGKILLEKSRYVQYFVES